MKPTRIYCGLWRAMLALAFLCGATQAAAQAVNKWTYKGGWTNSTRGWLDWQKNSYDGRYCLFAGTPSWSGSPNDVMCYDAARNLWETVYAGDLSKTWPKGGDEHAWGWDHTRNEYIMLDTAHFRPQAYAFVMATRSWRPITNADFAGIESRNMPFGAGTATSADHDLMVITHGPSGGNAVTRLLDLRNRTYSELRPGPGVAFPENRNLIQNMFMYVPSLRKFLLWGGNSIATGKKLNDLWLFDPVSKTWMQVTQAGTVPAARANAHMAYDADQNVVYLFGGNVTEDPVVHILRLSTFTWERLPVPAGTLYVDRSPFRINGVAMWSRDAGFCLSGGALSPARDWTDSLRTWCFQHSLASDTLPPASPAGNTSSFVPSDLGNLTASWYKSSSDPTDVARYEVQRSEDNGTTWKDQVTVIANGAATYNYTYAGVKMSRVRVRAVDNAGNASTYVELPVN
jgi:hypothetical protein